MLFDAVIKFKKTHKDAQLPTKGTEDSACWDLYSCEEVTIQPWNSRVIDVGLAIELPKGWVGKIYTRSGHGFKGLRVHLGIIDADYRGLINPCVYNHTPAFISLKKGERIAQIYFEKVPKVKLTFCDKLSITKRGEKGHGSTGK